ncbi:EF-hand calcium-binding domain-containing protein 4B-like isoform X3 [Cherax quadricarinatus]
MTEQDVGVKSSVGVDEVVDSWEVRAEELFTLCDQECKGFITKRDLQRLWGELPLDPDELERVFDFLDQDHNGFLSLREFTDGFGSHLGLVVEFCAEVTSSSGSVGEAKERHLDASSNSTNYLDVNSSSSTSHLDVNSSSSSTSHLDAILKTLSAHPLHSDLAVESVWEAVFGGSEDIMEESKLEQLVAALLHRLWQLKAEHAQLEAVLATKTEQYNQQVSQLYEELETHMSGEQKTAAVEHRNMDSQALAQLEQQVKESEMVLRSMEEQQQSLQQQLAHITATETATRQDNTYLSKHVERLEEDLARKDAELLQLTTALESLKKNTKNEKIRRARQAFNVSEGIARERECLVTQLDLLRTINTQLRDEHDQDTLSRYRCQDEASGPSSPTTSPGSAISTSSYLTVIPTPLMDLAQTTTTCTLPLRPPNTSEVAVQATGHHPQHSHRINDTRWTPGDGRGGECEHDEEYFKQNVSVEVDPASVMTPLTVPTETSLLHELLRYPPLCAHCQRRLSSDLLDTPTAQALHSSSLEESSSELLYDASLAESVAIQQCGEVFVGLSSDETANGIPSDINQARHFLWNSVRKQCPIMPRYSTTIIYHPAYHTTIQLLPVYYTQYTHHTCHIYHTYHTFILQSRDIKTKATINVEPVTTSRGIQESHLDQHQISQTLLQQDNLQGTKYCTSESVTHDISRLQESQSNLLQDDTHNVCVNHKNPCKKEVPTAPVNQSLGEGALNMPTLINNSTCKSQMDPDAASKQIVEIVDKGRREMSQKNSINDSSMVVPPLLHPYPQRDKMSKLNVEENKGCRNKYEKKVEPQASSNTLAGTPLVYCPSRMFKVVFIGDSGVGKTTFIHRAYRGEFRGDFGSTVGVDYQTLEMQMHGVLAVLQLWDTAGQERFRSITRQYYRKADSVVVMYDITSEQSFLNVVDWITSVKETAGDEVMIVMLGNKVDLQEHRCISQGMVDKLAKVNNCFTFECSAATGSGVQDVMMHIATLLTTQQVRNTPLETSLMLQDSFDKRICCK